MPESKGDARSRPFWSGTLSFGLVSIPVALHPATTSTRVSLRMLAPDGTPLRRRYVNPGSGEPVPWEGVARGYALEEGGHVVLSDEELEGLAPDRTRDIDLRRFVDEDALDPVFFERAYVLTPAGDSNKAYRLLAATMEEAGQAGLATFVMRSKEYLVAIVARDGVLRAETLRFAGEVRTPADVGLPDPVKPPAKAVKAMTAAIEALEEDELDEGELRDEDAERLLALVEGKKEEGADVVRPAAGDEGEEGDGGSDIIDLMEVLKRSLAGEGGGGKGRAGPRRAGRKAGGGTGSAGKLADLTKDELYERAKALDVPGRSSMTKDELLEAVAAAS